MKGLRFFTQTMNRLPEKLLAIGHIARPHGFRGEMQLHLLDTTAKLPVRKTKWLFLDLPGGPVPFLVERMTSAPGNAIIKLEDIDSEQAAKKLNGISCSIIDIRSEEDMQSDDNGVIGYVVTDKHSGELGPVKEVLEMPGQRILSVDHKGKEVLIPFKRPILVKTDHVAKSILVNMPEGLLDIYLNGGSQD